MAEDRMGYYYNIASILKDSSENNNYKILKSYYLMKCKEVTGGYGLPAKHFSQQIRCRRCCLEFDKGTNVTIKTKKLNKKQRRRLKSHQNFNLGNSNFMVKTCTFCNHATETILTKPKRDKTNNPNPTISNNLNPAISTKSKDVEQKKKVNVNKKIEIKTTTNLYTSALDVFSMKNEKNILQSSLKTEPKIIKNNKKRKDKFAGLCQKAVLATAKLKQEKKEQNKLALFLKPSS